jgi:hypothetical protein
MKNENKNNKVVIAEKSMTLSDMQNEGLLPTLSMANFDDIFSEDVQRISIDRAYLSFQESEAIEPGVVIKAVVTGFGEMDSDQSENGKTDTVYFQSNFEGDVRNYSVASKKLVGIFKEMKRFPVAVEIVYLGTKKSTKGFKYDDFKVSVLGYLPTSK